MTDHLLALGHRRFVHLASAISLLDLRRTGPGTPRRRCAPSPTPWCGPSPRPWTSTAPARPPSGRWPPPDPGPPRSSATTTSWPPAPARPYAALGLRVPEDISVTGFDDLALATAVEPELTTVSLPAERVGERGMAALLAVLEGRPPRGGRPPGPPGRTRLLSPRPDRVNPNVRVVRTRTYGPDPAALRPRRPPWNDHDHDEYGGEPDRRDADRDGPRGGLRDTARRRGGSPSERTKRLEIHDAEHLPLRHPRPTRSLRLPPYCAAAPLPGGAVVVAEGSRIRALGPDGSHPLGAAARPLARRHTATPGRPARPAVSPDGRLVSVVVPTLATAERSRRADLRQAAAAPLCAGHAAPARRRVRRRPGPAAHRGGLLGRDAAVASGRLAARPLLLDGLVQLVDVVDRAAARTGCTSAAARRCAR